MAASTLPTRPHPPNTAVSTDGKAEDRAELLSSDGEEATMIPLLVAFGSFLTTLAGGFAALRFHDQQHLSLIHI